MELFFDKDKLPDGFLWRIPRGSRTEYGMLGRSVSYRNLEEFFGISSYERRAGTISLGPVRSFSERVLLVGDAACQVKPWSGGGVIYGLRCADIAVRTIREALKRDDFSEHFLRRYEKEWRKALGKQIRLGMLYRRWYKRSSPRMIRQAFHIMRAVPYLNKLDMDLL